MSNRPSPGLGPLLLLFATAGLTACGSPSDGNGSAHQDHSTHADADSVTACDHAATESCFICEPSLRDEGRLWCQEHGRYEDRCFICHPELKDENRLWCKEHSLYEDECHLCRPELGDAGDTERTQALSVEPASAAGPRPDKPPARDPTRLWCTEHDIYEDECLICHPELGKAGANQSPALMCAQHRVPESECGICQPRRLSLHPLKVRMASRGAARRAGVESEPATRRERADAIEVYAEIGFDGNHMTHVALPLTCLVEEVRADLGQSVQAGDVLATVSSIEIGESVEAYLQVLTEGELRGQVADRERGLHERRLTTTQDLQEAEAAERMAAAAIRQAHARLETLGFSHRQIRRLSEAPHAPVHLELRAPFNGEIVARNAVHGAWLPSGTAIFTMADTSTMWARLDIPEALVRYVEPGQAVELTLDAFPGESARGTLTWVAAEIDVGSRLARARAEFPNPSRGLKANMFARARISTTALARAVVVPPSAIQQVDDIEVAFVELEPDLFEARPLVLGPRAADAVVVLSGVQAGEPVVVAGGNAVKSQLLLSRLGAGCVDD